METYFILDDVYYKLFKINEGRAILQILDDSYPPRYITVQLRDLNKNYKIIGD